MNLNDISEAIFSKQRELYCQNGCNNTKLSIYLGELLYLKIKKEIYRLPVYHRVSFTHIDDTIQGHPVYRVTNDDWHFKIVES